MALIKCKDCGKEYSSDAKACIHCGANNPNQPAERKGCLSPLAAGIVVVLILLFALGGGFSGNNTDEQKNHPEKYVLSVCMDFTKKWLHDRSSAEFDYPYPDPITMANNQYSMTLGLRAKNGFGALRHFAVNCMVRFSGDSWLLVSLKEVH